MPVLSVIESEVKNNTVTGKDGDTYGPNVAVAGMALNGPWESEANRPNFKVDRFFKGGLMWAFNQDFPVETKRWSNALGSFTQEKLAQYIVDIMLWNINAREASTDRVTLSIFQGNKGTAAGLVKVYQAAVANPTDIVRGAGGLQSGGNTIPIGEFQRPTRLLR